MRELLGIRDALPEEVEGGSLIELMMNGGRGVVQRPRDELVWHFPHYVDVKDAVPHSALRSDDLKFIVTTEDSAVFLYDLSRDLGESSNLVSERPAVARELGQKLDTYLQDVKASRARVPESPPLEGAS